jgi:hypothetical protein
MKVFKAKYSWSGRWQTYINIYCVVVANTEAEALGIVLHEHVDTDASGWMLDEIDTTKAGVTPIHWDER